MNRQYYRRRHKGFSLVELLVVIGIIVVLVGVLLTAIMRSRLSALDASCKSHLHQLAIAEVAYANDNKGVFTPALGDPHNLFGPSPQAIAWQVRLKPYISLPPLSDEFHLPQPQGRDPDSVINCPSRQDWMRSDAYSINRSMGPFRSDYVEAGIWAYRIAAVPRPSEIILLGDSQTHDVTEVGGGMNPLDAPVPPDQLEPTPSFRHHTSESSGLGNGSGTANFAFVDGHVEGLGAREASYKGRHWKWWTP